MRTCVCVCVRSGPEISLEELSELTCYQLHISQLTPPSTTAGEQPLDTTSQRDLPQQHQCLHSKVLPRPAGRRRSFTLRGLQQGGRRLRQVPSRSLWDKELCSPTVIKCQFHVDIMCLDLVFSCLHVFVFLEPPCTACLCSNQLTG